ncbi:MAG: antibiotic biosynthesis monooxygenase [Marinilabiliaceae bacterium]|nr:antibiotic biosynthesis monooxygenase [Marinilabiliaceae bacterium]
MIVNIVYVNVKTEFIEPFKKACIRNHKKSVLEKGNLRFDILQDDTDPSKFLLYEAWISDEAALFHKETLHYKEWRTQVEPWMASPRYGVKHNIIAPDNTTAW